MRDRVSDSDAIIDIGCGKGRMLYMTPFLQHVKDSAARHPRDIHIIYHNPVCHELFISEGFTFVEALPVIMSTVKYYVYLLPKR